MKSNSERSVLAGPLQGVGQQDPAGGEFNKIAVDSRIVAPQAIVIIEVERARGFFASHFQESQPQPAAAQTPCARWRAFGGASVRSGTSPWRGPGSSRQRSHPFRSRAWTHPRQGTSAQGLRARQRGAFFGGSRGAVSCQYPPDTYRSPRAGGCRARAGRPRWRSPATLTDSASSGAGWGRLRAGCTSRGRPIQSPA